MRPLPFAESDSGSAAPDLEIESPSLPDATHVHIEITEADFRAPPDWDSLKDRVLADIIPMVERLESELEILKLREGNHLAKYLTTNTQSFELPGLRGEINAIDHHPFFRIVHADTKLSVLLVDEKIAPESHHLRQVVARQHIDAGEEDPKGRKSGRDTVVVRRQGDRLVSEYLPRHIPGSPDWWGDYYHASYKETQLGDYALASYCTVMQMGLASCLGLTRWMLGTSFDVAPIVISGIFAALIGSRVGLYRTWSYRGSEASKILKLSEVGFANAYAITIISKGANVVFNITDPHSLLLHSSIAFNNACNQKGRVSWQKVAEIRERLRYSAGEYDLTAFFERWTPKGFLHWLSKTLGTKDATVKIGRANFYNQNIYLIPFTLKLAGLVGVGAKVTLPFLGYQIDTGPLLLLASIPIALWVVSQYGKLCLRSVKSSLAHLKIQHGASEGERRVELESLIAAKEHEIEMVTKINHQLGAEQSDVWSDLYKPHKLLKRVSLFFVDTAEEIHKIWWPITRETAKHVSSGCAEWFLNRLPWRNKT
ncbi:MAG: hypothetical protein HYR96_12525 [Deltaproteobacteria bacterium]|nr:hypothetical protein [Deltaproteobacteria bacterium]MBI3296158.1 hypothetical protein [Deltaproteobacteria bacterium]